MKNKKPKICLFTDTFCDANGVSRFLQDMSKEAKKQDIELHIITSTLKTYCDVNENIHNFKPIFKSKMPFYKELDLVFPPILKMAKLLKELKPDLIHISTPGFIGWIGLFIARKNKIPILGTYHTDFPMYLYKNTNSKFLKNATAFFLKLFYKNFEALLTRSQEYIENIHLDIGFDKNNIYHLQPGTNITTFDPKYYNENLWSNYGLNNNSIKFLYVGRATKEKNVDILFDIFKEFYKKSKIKNSHLIMVGSGELDKQKEELKNYNIVFLGHKQKDELSSIYASSSIFVFPSTTDTLGQVVLESMASKTPVIVTNKGGPMGIVNGCEEQVGFILDINDKNKWIDLLLDIEKETINLNKLSDNAHRYSSNFSITKTFDSFYKIHIETQK